MNTIEFTGQNGIFRETRAGRALSLTHPSIHPCIHLFIYRDALGKIFCCVLRFLITIFVLFLYLFCLT